MLALNSGRVVASRAARVVGQSCLGGGKILDTEAAAWAEVALFVARSEAGRGAGGVGPPNGNRICSAQLTAAELLGLPRLWA